MRRTLARSLLVCALCVAAGCAVIVLSASGGDRDGPRGRGDARQRDGQTMKSECFSRDGFSPIAPTAFSSSKT